MPSRRIFICLLSEVRTVIESPSVMETTLAVKVVAWMRMRRAVRRWSGCMAGVGDYCWSWFG